MKFTDDQLRAIHARGKNLIVSAAAGSGKTKVLVERIISLIEEGVNVDEMLIITFTRAASAEMRSRLSARMYEWANEGHAQEAYSQLERLEYAQICTIDSFCADIVRTYFELSDCDPNFRVIDAAQDESIKQEALSDALEAAYAQGIGRLGEGRTPDEVKALVRKLLDFLEDQADAGAWYARALALAESDGSRWREKCEAQLRRQLDGLAAQLRRALAVANEYDGPYQYADTLEEELRQAEALARLDPGQLAAAEMTFKARLPQAKGVNADKKDECSRCRKSAKELWDKISGEVKYDYAASLEDIHADIPAFKRLYEIAMDTDARAWEAKKEISGLTFSDIERRAVLVMRDDEAARGIRERYKYIFVDEYQDTSDIQELLVSRAAGDRNLFMVGDVKQSIYRFRGAEPQIFQEKCRLYERGGDNEQLLLRENFRSSAAVLECVNRIFSRVMNGGDSEIEYNEGQRLNYGGSFEGKTVPCEILIADNTSLTEDSGKPRSTELSDTELEGRMIARRIRELMDSEGLKFRDFCILERASTDFVKLSEVLAEQGIHCYTEKSENFFDLIEVDMVMAVLRLVVSGRNDLDILTVLRSPIIGMSTSEIADMRAESPAVPLWTALRHSRERFPGCAKLLDLVEDLRVCAYGMSTNRVIRRLLDKTGLYAFVGGLDGGTRRQGNLDLLCQRACKYEKDVGGSLADFVDYAANLRQNGDNAGAHELGEGDDVVRIMTDHKSKGLQFRVVFAAGLDRVFNTQGNSRGGNDLLLDKDLGFALIHCDTELDTRRNTFARQAIQLNEQVKDTAEELRVLYVTLTRAVERLIMTGVVADSAKSIKNWQAQVTDVNDYNSSLDIVCAAAVGCPGAEILGGKPEAGAPEIDVKLYGARELEEMNMVETVTETTETEENSGIDLKELEAMLDWKYPEPAAPYAPVKLAVTGLEREFTGGLELPEIHSAPEFMSDDEKRNPAGRGTAVHQALRNMDYDRLRGAADMTAAVAEQVDEMCADGRLLPEESSLVTVSELADFFESELGRRVLKAEIVKREWSFCLRMPTERVIENYPAGSDILVQGTIDLCFIENGKWVLVDYKTSHTKDEQKLVERYSSQIDLYAEALETLTGTEVGEALLCLVSARRVLRLKPERWHKR